jgi:Na+-translocating ferredoxin:NAD+ oxidoreductase RnfC subunit
MSLVDQVKNAGVVGAGGAGFPTHVKLQANVEWLLANGAECEPLLHKDREIMVHFAKEIVEGIGLAAASVKADKRYIGIKTKNQDAVDAVRKAIAGSNVQIKEFGDFYPAGDEYELVYGITGKLIPPQGLPLDVGAVVNNVETLYNVHRAAQGIPVTEKFLTIAGLVNNPLTAWVPVGMKFRDLLELAGGAKTEKFGVMESGLMMGKLVDDLDKPVTKTTGGLIVLPADHDLIRRYSRPAKSMDKIGHSACDQCSYCTELCPRYLLGYDIEPHLVMRSLGFSLMGAELWNEYAMLCCKCGICTLYACPEALYPREACVRGINDLKAVGKVKWQGEFKIKAHPMKEARRVPTEMLMSRLGVTRYESHAGYAKIDCDPEQVHILLQQHIGVPAKAAVKVNERVKKGQLIADIEEGRLGARIHASMDGKIAQIDEEKIVIKKDS